MDKTDWTDKNGFFCHKRHKRVWVDVDGLSLFERRFEKFEKFKRFFITKGTKGFEWMLMVCLFLNADETDWIDKNGFFLPQKAQKGVGECWLAVSFGTRMKRIERIKTDFFYHKWHKRVLGGSWWVVSFEMRSKQIGRIKTDFFWVGNCVLDFFGTRIWKIWEI